MFVNVFFIVFILLISIFFHELGHIIFAKIIGYDVNKFSVGMGRKIFKFVINKTKISIRIIPFGGKVFISEQCKNPLHRIVFTLGGPFFNILLAFAGIFVFDKILNQSILYVGDTTSSVGWIAKDSVLYREGVLAGDSIKINKLRRTSITEIMRYLYFSGDSPKSYKIFVYGPGNGFKFEIDCKLSSLDSGSILPVSHIYYDKLHRVISYNGINATSHVVDLGTVDDNGNCKSLLIPISRICNSKLINEIIEVNYDEKGNPINLDYFDWKSFRFINGNKVSSIEDVIKELKAKKISILYHDKNSNCNKSITIQADRCTSMSKSRFVVDMCNECKSLSRGGVSDVSYFQVIKFYILMSLDVFRGILSGSSNAIEMISGPSNILIDSKEKILEPSTFITFFVALNIQWSLINMIPLYFLDGGAIVANFICLIFKKWHKKINYAYFLISFFVAMFFFVFQIVRKF